MTKYRGIESAKKQPLTEAWSVFLEDYGRQFELGGGRLSVWGGGESRKTSNFSAAKWSKLWDQNVDHLLRPFVAKLCARMRTHVSKIFSDPFVLKLIFCGLKVEKTLFFSRVFCTLSVAGSVRVL
jgi:hypothetical protein